ncbi:MAG: phosphoglycerate kinase [Aestuariivita sp.]|uniref:phosphoglycerate kinase n=1 Tax=Aestuariivita sp. TaxID=1872407 RepID=UPI003BAE1FBF
MDWKTLDDMEMSGKRVLVRVDLNVPTENGQVSDDTRIQRLLPTISDILHAGGTPILLSHFGRPKGTHRADLSLRMLIPALEAAFHAPVVFCADCRGPAALATVESVAPGSVVLLENTRFYPGEEKNDPELARDFAALGDIFCNDAFSCAHRAHASTTGVARLLPSCAGRLMQAELIALEAALGNPQRPLVAVVGGAKVSTKLDLLSNLVAQVDYLVIGGGMANTFLAAQGIPVGTSLAEHDMTDTASDILAKAAKTGCEIVLPSDIVVARALKANAESHTVPVTECPADAMILDAGPESVARIGMIMEDAHTLIWNGPLGAFEIEPFGAATFAAARKAAAMTKAGRLVTVAGGGDTVAALNMAGAAHDFTYISTAGGAFLEWMEGKTLPGVAALRG